VLGAPNDESALGEAVARQWLDRYGVVGREIWRRERPMVPWRAVYRELKRLEFRGDVRRGYFVRGLSGAQFALPEAVEALRADEPGDDEAVVIAAADPANVFSLPLPGDPARDPFVRPRSSSALLVAVGGRVVLIAERRGSRVAARPDTDEATIARAAQALVKHLSSRLRRDLVLETIDGQPSAASPHAAAFEKAGFRRGRTDMRYLRPAR
jgi:ATP-dependent Lhr-like helicase